MAIGLETPRDIGFKSITNHRVSQAGEASDIDVRSGLSSSGLREYLHLSPALICMISTRRGIRVQSLLSPTEAKGMRVGRTRKWKT